MSDRYNQLLVLKEQIRQLTERAEKAERDRDHWMNACKSDSAKMFEAMQEREALAEKLRVATEALGWLADNALSQNNCEFAGLALAKIRGDK